MSDTATTLATITPLTEQEEARLTKLLSNEEQVNGVSVEESHERTSLIFKRQANRFKELATDDNVDKKADENYEVQAIANWDAYVRYTA